jgi:hypothetical protein
MILIGVCRLGKSLVNLGEYIVQTCRSWRAFE